MSKFEFEIRRIWKLAALVFCAALAALLAFLFWQEAQEKEESRLLYDQMEEALRPLNVKMYDLEKELESLEKAYTNQYQGMGSVIFLFTDLDEIIYTDIYPQMKEYGFTGVLCLSSDDLPGRDGCLSQSQFKELLDAGWTCCLVWQEDMGSEEWLAACREMEEEAGVERPDTVYTVSETYSGRLDSFLEEQGFSAIVHHGEEELPLILSDSEEGIWHPGAVAWLQDGASSLLASATSQGGNLIFTIGSDSEAEQYEEGQFASMLEKVDGYCKEDSLFVADFIQAREYRRTIESRQETVESEWTRQKTDLENQIEKLDEEIDAVTDNYLEDRKDED